MSNKNYQHIPLNTNDKTKPKDDKHLPDKLFVARNSLLTDLFENVYIQMNYNLAAVVFIGLSWTHFLKNFYTDGRYFWDRFFIFLTIFYYFGVLLFIPTKLLLDFNLPIGSCIVSSTECVRMVMKCHAYIRGNGPKVLHFKQKSDQNLPLASLAKYIYFSFAPTLVYRDEYPRSKEVRWNIVFKFFLEVFVCIILMGLIFLTFVEKLDGICLTQKKWTDLIYIIFSQGLMGLMMTLIFFYMLLHAWMNAFAEMLRLSDRLFYKDWWTSNSYQRFYRTWNNVVHDWLYIYILKDCYEVVFPQRKMLSRISVVLISAVFHEFILIVCLRFFFPLFFFCFVIPTLVFFSFREAKHWIFNWGVLYAQGLGISIFLIMYGVEYLARLHCPYEEEDTWAKFLTPKFVRCQCFV